MLFDWRNSLCVVITSIAFPTGSRLLGKRLCEVL